MVHSDSSSDDDGQAAGRNRPPLAPVANDAATNRAGGGGAASAGGMGGPGAGFSGPGSRPQSVSMSRRGSGVGSRGSGSEQGSRPGSRSGTRLSSGAGSGTGTGGTKGIRRGSTAGTDTGNSEERNVTWNIADEIDTTEVVAGVPELWYNKDGKKILVRRMIDDFCRQGMSDGVVLGTLVNEYMDVMNEYNITAEHLRGIRAKLDNDLPGVPGESRPAYRQAVVKAAGNLIVPWDRKVNPIGTSRVELSQLGITTVPAEIFNFPLNSLFRILQLDNNLLTSFTKDFCRLTELTQLRLDRNRIDYVHESIGKMRSLRVLFLQHNKIVMLPWEIGLLTKLEALNIDHNKIEYMPITLGRLTNLKELKMGANPTCKAPPPHITSKSNRVQVDYIKRLDNGDTTGSMNLCDLELTGFPTELLLPKLFHCLRVSHTTITSLDLRKNQIQGIADSYNILGSKYDVGKQLSCLTKLDLSQNKLKLIPRTVVILSRLTSLNVEGNDKVTSLPVELSSMTNLTELKLTLYRKLGSKAGDLKPQFVSPPLNVLKNGTIPAVWDEETGELAKPGNALGVIHYLRMIEDAKRTRKLYHQNMDIDRFCPEVSEMATAPKSDAEEKAHSEAMEAMFCMGTGDLISMEYIYYQRNKMSRLPRSIGVLTRLVYLCADNNMLVAIPDEVGNLVNLRELGVSHNRIKALPNQLGNCTQMRRLALQHNRLESVPGSIGRMPLLDVLRLEGNEISELPEELMGATSLVTLTAGSNKLQTLPEGIAGLQRIVHLCVERNSLERLPVDIGMCPVLAEMDVSDNKLEELPESIGLMTSLSILRMDGNGGMRIPPPEVIVKGIPVVREYLNTSKESRESNKINMANKGLMTFPPQLLKWVDVVWVDLSYNDLREIPTEIESMSELEVLRVQHNRLESLPENIGNLIWIKSLHADNNRIVDVPESIANLDRLTDLSLQFNNLKMLPLGLGALLNLKSFTIANNPLEEPPPDVVDGPDGSRLAYNYLRSIFNSVASNMLLLDGIGLNRIPVLALEHSEMESIYMARNVIGEIPPGVSNLGLLRELHLQDNMIKQMPEELKDCTSLRYLDLSGNQIPKLDAVVLDLPSLQVLNVGRNQITSIPQGIHRLTELITLCITSNPVSALPATVGLMTSLTELRFDDTKVRKAPMSIGNLTNLRCLRMDVSRMEEPRAELCEQGLQILIAYMQKFDDAYSTSSLDVHSWGIKTFPTELLSYNRPPQNISLGPLITSLNMSRNRLSVLPESFAMLVSLTDLNLQGNSFNRVPGAVCYLTQLEKLNMEDNFHLRRLPVELCSMMNLKTLAVTQSRIVSPPIEIVQKLEPNDWAFCNLGVIEYFQRIDDARDSGLLNLQRMGLRRFPPEVMTAVSVFWDYNQFRGTFITGRGNLDVLTQVKLEGNNITVLPSCIGQLTRVHFMDLSGNSLRALPPSLGNMSSIETLVLSKNRLTVINDAIANLTKLSKLQLQENELEHVTEEIGKLQNLTEISLSHNLLTYLPHSIPQITNLKNLLVTANDLCTDPSDWGVPGVSHEIGLMPNLIELNVEQNEKLMVPPRDMWKGPSDRLLEFMRLVVDARETAHMSLHDMGLRSVPEVVVLMDYLETLSLCDNSLRALPKNISQITSLTLLELDRNDLVMFPEEATKISNLTELRASYNQLKSLPETCNRWIRVERIIATDNKIRHLPEGLCEMPRLTDLNLERNKLKDLPEAIVLCTSLTHLRFSTEDMVKASPAQSLPSGIRRVEIPCEIAICGVDEIINHFFKMHKAWSTHSLDISGFGIRTLMMDVCSLSVLTHLNLAANRIKYLPSEFTQLRELRSLNLENCYNLEYFHHHIHVLTNLKRISIKGGALDNKHYPQIKMKWPPTLVAREPALMRNYLGELNMCVGHHYVVKGIKYWDTSNRLDYRFVPHEAVLDEITTAEIPSIATRSFPNFPPEINTLNLTALTELHIPGGQITADMMAQQIPTITNIKKLVLVDQKINRICEEVTMLQKLEVLTLTGNKIKEIPAYLCEMHQIKKLVFVENHLAKIPPEIGQMSNLTELVLTYNKLTAIPKEIGQLYSLDYLVLDENRIRVIPDAIEKLTALRELSFNDNRITRFPMSMGALTQLQILEFGQNPTFSLPPSQVLKCDVPVIIDFMKRIWDCHVNHKLNFRNFQLNNSFLVEIMKEVEEVCFDLNISKNNMKELPFELKKLTGLTALNVSDNDYVHLNLALEVEAAKREKKKKEVTEIKANNLYKFFEDLEMIALHDILIAEYNVKKMRDLRPFVSNEENLDQLGLVPADRAKLELAVSALPLDDDDEEGLAAAEEEEGLGEEEAAEEEEEEEEEEIDEEEAERQLQRAQGPQFKFNPDVFRQMAHDAKVAFYSAYISAVARFAERRRRKELREQDRRVKQKASGFKRKQKRLEGEGVPTDATKGGKGKKKKKGRSAGLSLEQQAEKEAEAAARKEKYLAEKEKRNKDKQGDIDAIELKQEAGGGIVHRNIYSVAIFTSLTELKARRNKLEYIPEDIGDLTALVKLDVSHNELRWIPPSFTKLVKLTNLDIRHNHLYELPLNFGSCTSIEALVLDHNKFYDLPESMANMPKLKSLSLDWNDFLIIPPWLDKCGKIETLSFNFNKVKRLANAFGQMDSLTELRFTNNDFSSFPYILSHLQNLRIADMSGNPIGTLPESVGGCRELEELYINECHITHMSIDVAHCRKLKVFEFLGNDDMTYPPTEVQARGQDGVLRYFRAIIACETTNAMMLDDFDVSDVDLVIFKFPECTMLDYSRNNLMKVPAELRQLNKIESLNLSRNKLGAIPRVVSLMNLLTDLTIDSNGIENIEPSIKLLTGLTRLSLANNRIMHVHHSIFHLTSLIILNLTNNKIEEVPDDVSLLENLVTLGLGDNEIEVVPDDIQYLQSLRQLVLFGNKISVLPTSLRKLWYLEVLTVSQNSLTDFPVELATDLTSLRELWLGHNKLRGIPRDMHKLVALEQLWLQDNLLEAIPQELGMLTKLKVLTLTGNRIREIPRAVKNLRIVQHADPDKLEEFWQDPEKDTFTATDAEDDENTFRSFTSSQSGNTDQYGGGGGTSQGIAARASEANAQANFGKKPVGSPRMIRKTSKVDAS